MVTQSHSRTAPFYAAMLASLEPRCGAEFCLKTFVILGGMRRPGSRF